MSKAKVATSTSSGGLSLSFIVGSVVAFCTNPTFTGLVGIGKSLLVGVGTSVGSSLIGFAGAVSGVLGGAVVGGLIGAAFRRPRVGAVAGLFVGGLAGGVGGGVYGAVEGYKLTEGWLLEKDAKSSFNINAIKEKTPDMTKTVVLDAKAFAQFKPN